MKVSSFPFPLVLLFSVFLFLPGLGCDDSSSKPKDKCINEVLDGDETGIDCGGSCEPCGLGEACLVPGDCTSGICGDDGFCGCADGFENVDGACADIDECTGDLDDCDVNAACTNTEGSFTCACNEGYVGDGVTCVSALDCALGEVVCDADATCTEQETGSFCICNAGYTGDGVTCADIDECDEGTDTCDENAACTNLEGGYSCACNDGFTGDGMACTDIDECDAGTDNCDANSTCTNTTGSFTCDCNDGYAGDGVTCANVDECDAGTDNCSDYASCLDLEGSFSCECLEGYTGDGVTCTNIDECTENTDNCDANALCSDTEGSFTCLCNEGYAGDGVTCTDIDECTENLDNCDANAACANLTGGFTCTCNGGYTGDGVTCTNLDECTLNTDNCHANATCTDTAGSFTCACNGGYSGDGVTCTNLDECALNTDNCHANATCTDTTGSFTCVCIAGYTGDGVNCTDIDECDEGTDDCDANATCTNTPGDFTCACNAGYYGDGVTCTDNREMELVIEPVADAYTNSLSAATNYGTATQFIVDRTTYYSYLRFDLSTLPTFTGFDETAFEVVSYTGYAYGGDGNVYVYETDSDTWGETTINHTNRPGVIGSSLGYWFQWYNSNTAERLNTVNTPELLAAIENSYETDGLISFRLHSPGYRTNYRSREYSDSTLRPRLRIRLLLLPTCAEILTRYPGSASGIYTLDPDGFGGPLPSYEAYCDMVTDGGGWTRIVATNSYRHDWGQTTAAIVSAYAAADAAIGTYDAFRYVQSFEEVMLKKTAGANNVGDFASYLLVEAISGRSVMDILQNDCKPATCASGNDTIHDGARVQRPVSSDPLGAWTSMYSGVRVNGALQMKNPANATVLPQYFFMCGVNESSDNDQSVLAFTDANGTTNTWDDFWRYDYQYGALWSFWNGDYHSCPTTQHIGNGYAHGFAGYKGQGAAWQAFHAGSYEVYIR